MLKLIGDLVRHKWYAHAVILTGIRGHETAAQDRELNKVLHFMLFMDRRYMFTTMNRNFNREEKSADWYYALDPLIARFRETEALEIEWLSSLAKNDLKRR